jgi:hypothetical protein
LKLIQYVHSDHFRTADFPFKELMTPIFGRCSPGNVSAALRGCEARRNPVRAFTSDDLKTLFCPPD